MYAGVVVELINKNIDKVFSYKIPSNLNVKIGERVLVPFGRMNLEGFVVEINDNKPDYDIKEINSLIDDEPVLNEEMLELGKYICKKTLCTLSSSYQTMLPKALKAKNGSKVNIKYETYIAIDKDINLDGKRKEIYDLVKKNGKVLKRDLNNISTYITKDLIKSGIWCKQNRNNR